MKYEVCYIVVTDEARDDPMGDHAAKLPGDTPQCGAAGRELLLAFRRVSRGEVWELAP